MNKPNLKPLIIIGGGGHASVLVDILLSQKRKIIAVVCPSDLSERAIFNGIDHYTNNEDVFRFKAGEILLVNGVGVMANSLLKRDLNYYYLSRGYKFETVIAKNAEVSPFAEISHGVQIFHGVKIQAGTKIASHTIINSGVIVEHDCDIGEYNHIAPAATLCGKVKTAENVFIGAGAIIIQNITLEENIVVGAGAIVTKHLLASETCYPSRSIIKQTT